jgi:hypothetical protein
MDKACSMHGKEDNCVQNSLFFERPEGTEPLGRYVRGLGDDIKIVLKIGWEGVNRIQVAPLASSSAHDNKLSGFFKYEEIFY